MSATPRSWPLNVPLVAPEKFVWPDVRPFRASNYRFKTSKEDSETVAIATHASGTIVLENFHDGSEIEINYSCLMGGVGKGLPVNVATSTFDNYSAGTVLMTCAPLFGPSVFPCRGYMGSGGAGAGALLSGTNGVGVTTVLFGVAPVFAYLFMWGSSASVIPNLGVGVGVASFTLPGARQTAPKRLDYWDRHH